MKGEIILLEWLEQHCFNIRSNACENQKSLLKQQETNMKLVKNRIYAAAVNPEIKNDKHLLRVCVLQGLNFDGLEQNKEIRIVSGSDVFVSKNDDEQVQTENQVALIEPDALFNGNGVDILNQSHSALTYNVKLNTVAKHLMKKQNEGGEKYLDLATKPVLTINRADFESLTDLCQGGGN